MRSIQRLLVPAVLLAVMATGCFTHTYRTGMRAESPDASYSAWHHHVLWGLWTVSDDVMLDEICPQGVSVAHNRMTFVNGLVGALTAHIWSPRTVKVWCTPMGPVGATDKESTGDLAGKDTDVSSS